MDPNAYRFHMTWSVPAGPDAVFAALEAVDRYPAWWPEVRSTHQLDERSGEVVCRSWLPIELRLTLRQVRRDPVGRVLEADVTGDLEGWLRWSVTGTAGASRAVLDQEVVARKPILRRLAWVGRPAFRLNHARMMRHGGQGLARHLG